MSSINLMARLANLWRGFVSLWVSDIEKNHPEIAYENAIRGMVDKYTKLRSATAAIVRRREEIDARLKDDQRALDQVNRDLEAALATQQDDLALILIQKKEALDSVIAELANEMQQANGDAEEAKSALLSVKSEIDKLKAERDRMLAQMKSAQARLAIQSQLDGLSVDAEVQALDKVREHIKNTVSEAKLARELHESDLDVRLKKLQGQSGNITAQAKLDELKRQRAAQATTQRQL
ncbi:MAG TPA: PspA/IM30 family protein [Lysobacter sp.]|jgi:phage shock protein A|nr:PspA/IM30 family protein [Lysobacter sp.]